MKEYDGILGGLVRLPFLIGLSMLFAVSFLPLSVVSTPGTAYAQFLDMEEEEEFLEEEEEEEEEGVAEEEEVVEIPEGVFGAPEIASSPDNPNRDILAAEDWEVPIGKFPLFGLSNRSIVWVIAQLHILFASFILGVPLFVIIAEIMGWRSGDARYERLAKEVTKVVAMCYSFTALFGGFFLLLLVAFYPTFITWMFRGFSTLVTVVYPVLFVLETVLLYCYYYMWDPLNKANRKGLHILIGLALNVVGITLLIVMDAPASFMLTPPQIEGSVKGIATFGEWAWINNFSWWPLNIHRLVGNLTFGGYIVGLIGALMYMMSKSEEDRGYYDWQGYLGNTLGVAFMLPLPFAGYLYAYEAYQYDAAIGMYIMSDRLSMFMLVQAVLIGFLFIGSNYYMWVSMKRIEGAEKYLKIMRFTFVILFVCAAIWFAPRHYFATMLIEPGMVPEGMTKEEFLANTELPGTLAWVALMKSKNTAALTMILTTLFNYILYRVAIKKGKIVWGRINPVSQYILVFLAFSDVWLMSLMGSIRELSRKNYHVYRVFKDMTPDAFTPTLAYAATLMTVIVWIFFILMGAIIWMQLRMGKSEVEAKKGLGEVIPVPIPVEGGSK